MTLAFTALYEVCSSEMCRKELRNTPVSMMYCFQQENTQQTVNKVK